MDLNWIGPNWICIELGWVRLDWIEMDLDWIGLGWVGFDWAGLDWIAPCDCLKKHYRSMRGKEGRKEGRKERRNVIIGPSSRTESKTSCISWCATCVLL